MVHAVRAQPRVPCGRTCRCRDRGATPAFPRALNLQRGVGAGKISRSPHPLRSTRRLSAAGRNPNPFSAMNPSARRRSPEPSTRGGERRRLTCSCAIFMSIGRRKTELAAVQPHTMHPELARHCDDRAFMAALRRDPSLQCFGAAPLLGTYRHARRFVEYGAHLPIRIWRFGPRY